MESSRFFNPSIYHSVYKTPENSVQQSKTLRHSISNDIKRENQQILTIKTHEPVKIGISPWQMI